MTKQTCPQCGSSKVIYYLYGYPPNPPEILQEELGYFRVVLMGCMPPFAGKSERFDHKCFDCEYEWRVEDNDEDDE